MKVLGKYKITYIHNTKLKYTVSQYKYLIEYFDYINDIKPKLNKIYDLGLAQCQISKKNKRYKEYEAEINQIKHYISSTYGEHYFTNTSILWKSQYDKNIIPKNWGEIKVILEKI